MKIWNTKYLLGLMKIQNQKIQRDKNSKRTVSTKLHNSSFFSILKLANDPLKKHFEKCKLGRLKNGHRIELL